MLKFQRKRCQSMANQFYSPGEMRAAKVNDLFGVIARRYDLTNDLQSFGLHRLWKRRLVRLADPHPGERALDLCCGTGDIALALAQRDAEVIALDFSGPMLAVAEARLERLRTENASRKQTLDVRFIRGDAQRLPFPDNSFAVVTVGYGLRNLTQWQTGLHEMRRVATPGGRLLVLDFGKPDNPLWRAVYFAYLGWFVPALGRLLCGSAAAYAYILESLRPYPAQQGMAAAMRGLDLEKTWTINLLGGIMSINYGEKARLPAETERESRCQADTASPKMSR